MKGTVTRCDNCGGEDKQFESVFGGFRRSWIVVSRTDSQSGDVIGAGRLDFCNDGCLIEYIDKRRKA